MADPRATEDDRMVFVMPEGFTVEVLEATGGAGEAYQRVVVAAEAGAMRALVGDVAALTGAGRTGRRRCWSRSGTGWWWCYPERHVRNAGGALPTRGRAGPA